MTTLQAAAQAQLRQFVEQGPPPADFEPLVGPTRAVVIWRGRRWAEIDPATRRRVAKGREGERT